MHRATRDRMAGTDRRCAYSTTLVSGRVVLLSGLVTLGLCDTRGVARGQRQLSLFNT